MNYRFWTLSMPHLSHFRSRSAPHILSSVTDPHDRKLVLQAVHASELYMQCAFIAMGIVKLLAAQEPVGGVVQKYTPKRTHTSRKVSEADVCEFLRAHQSVILRKYQSKPFVSFWTSRMSINQELEEAI